MCDGQDNDCDGLTDETENENDPANDPGGVQGWVVEQVATIDVNGVPTTVYLYEASHPTATLTDGGLGTPTRACSRPDVIPWSLVTYAQAARACARAGMRLCRADEWEEACDGTGTNLYPYGNGYSTTACNGHDSDPVLDQVEPTGTQTNCDSQGYGAEDLSGNLREWTDDFVGLTTDSRRIFRLRGGSYIDFEDALRCDYTNNAYVEDALAPNIGFRCCSTCGNGYLDPGEACDPVLEPGVCHPEHCGYLTCGNGTTEAGEECDDGNLLPADGCSPACLVEQYCGDGQVQLGEECDDGNLIAWDGCSPGCVTEDTLLSEDFDSCPPTAWTIIDGGQSTDTWFCAGPNANETGSPSGQRYIRVDSDAAGNFPTHPRLQEELITPMLDLSGYTAAGLSFYHFFAKLVGGGDYGTVDYSTSGTGGPWTTLLTTQGGIGRVVIDLAPVVGQSQVWLRFYYDDNRDWAWYWSVDDVEVYAY